MVVFQFIKDNQKSTASKSIIVGPAFARPEASLRAMSLSLGENQQNNVILSLSKDCCFVDLRLLIGLRQAQTDSKLLNLMTLPEGTIFLFNFFNNFNRQEKQKGFPSSQV